MNVLKPLHFFASITLCCSLHGQSIAYSPSDDLIANPERGFYHHEEVHSGNYTLLNEDELRTYRESESVTQILRIFYLEQFVNKPISEAYLNNMRKDFSIIRKAGIKAVIRFAYTTKSTGPFGDATPEMVLLHISQLKPVVHENADVIAVWQAGFIGAWGEWYYTDHFAQSPGTLSQTDVENRKRVIDALLDAIPEDRAIQIRTPGYKMRLFGTETAIDESQAFTGLDLARVGHHNDCFVASSSDFGTYLRPEIEKPYLEQETMYLPMGGETCNVASPYSDCTFSEGELERFHWSYLNRDYNTSVLDDWSEQGCFDEVERRLGYRHRLVSSTYTSQTKPEGIFELSITLINDGYANFYNKRGFEVILRNASGNEYVFHPDSDPRKWPIGVEHTIQISAGIPQNVVEGDYTLYMNLPDSYPSIKGRPEYAVQFANTGTWDSDLGYNDLGATVSVSSQNAGSTYAGDDFFMLKQAKTTLQLDGSDVLLGGASSIGVLLFWPPQSQDLTRHILRKSPEGSYQAVASLQGNVLSWVDTEAHDGSFDYRYYLANDSGETDSSSTISIQSSSDIYPEFTIDGNDTDWGTIRPVLATSETDMKGLRVFFGPEHLHLFAYSATSILIFLDIDNDPSTGEDGFDFRIDGDEVAAYDNGSWISKTTYLSQKSGLNTEGQVPLSVLTGLESNQQIRMKAQLDNTVLENFGEDIHTHVRSLPPDLPMNFTVKNSATLDTRLIIEWSECTNCDGFVIERSVDGESFEVIAIPGPSGSQLRDDNLENHTIHYYRMASFNSIGKSEYTTIVQAKTGEKLLGLPVTDHSFYPNPVKDVLVVPGFDGTIALFTLDGKKVHEAVSIERFDLINIKSGLYLIKLTDAKGKESSGRVIKQ